VNREKEFDDELETHLSLLIEKFTRQGMTPEDAFHAARRQFGGITQVKQQRRDSTGFTQFGIFANDVGHAIRMLWKAPGFTVMAVAALTLGIGVNIAIFSVINAVILRPLKAPDAERIVRFLNTNSYGSSPIASFPQFNAWSRQTTLFEDVSAHRIDTVNLTGGLYPEQVPLARVSAKFFRLFGAPVALGRTFNPDEDVPAGAKVVVLSYELWARRFGRDPKVLGTSLVLGSEPHTVIGVLGPGFDTEQFDPLPEAWVPFQIDPHTNERGSFCAVSGRLKPGVTLATANAELRSIANEYRRTLLSPNPRATFTVQPVRDAMVSEVRPALLLLAAAVGLVLVIACANVANLMLARATGRKREIAIRAAVGASRGRILRQLLTEGLVLSLVGGALGLAVGMFGIRGLLAVHIPRIGENGAGVNLDGRVMAFTVLISLATGILFGLVPALQASRTDLTDTLKETSSRSGSGLHQTRARALFVMSEMALALVLLVGAALLIRTYTALRAVNPGFETSNVLATQMSLTATRFEKTAAMGQLVRDGVERLRALPGVTAASSACCIPLETVWQLPFFIGGRPQNGSGPPFAGWTFIAPEYFDTFKIPVVRGRAFLESDRAGAPAVVIINQAMAQRFWPQGDPLSDRLIIGRGIRPEYERDGPRQIVGIVGDVRDTGLSSRPRPAMYVPIAQLPDDVNVINLRLLPIAWFVRVRSEHPSTRSSIESELREASGGLPVTRIRSMEEVEGQSTARSRFEMTLMTIFGCSAVLLAAIGIYGLMAFAVEQRTQEIGIRLALGAGPSAVRNMVIRQAMRLALAGVAAGITAAFGLTRLLSSFLFEVRPRDPVVFIASPILLVVIALLAAWVPARRATRVDPVNALRWE